MSPRRSLIVSLFLMLTLAAAGVARAEAPDCGEEILLGLELTGDLQAPTDLTDRIAVELALIRDYYPQVAEIQHKPSWVAGYLIVALTDEAWAEYLAGTYTALDTLNAQYGIVHIEPYLFAHYLKLSFAECLHPVRLAEIYGAAEGVRYASANGIGGDGDDIYMTGEHYYTFKMGWGDCLSGCMYEAFWEFYAEPGYVRLLAAYGDPVSGVEVAPAAARLEQNAPNPFNPETLIRYGLERGSHVRLSVHDARGRLVRELQNERVELGDHRISWNGRDARGAQAPSGVYYYVLSVDGAAQAKKMLLVK